MNEKLIEIIKICMANHFNVSFQNTNPGNYIVYKVDPEMMIDINIGNEEDDELDKILSDTLNELKQLFH